MHTKESSRLTDAVFRDLVETTSDGIAIQAADRIVYANAAMLALLVMPPDAVLIGRNLLDFAAPASRPQITACLESPSTRTSAEEMQLITFDGSVRDVEVTVSPVDVNGTTAAAITIRNISDRVASEREARASLERAELLAQATSDAVWEWNLDSDDIIWSGSLREVLGWDSGRVTVAWWLDRIHDDDRARVNESMQRVLASRESFWSDEYRFGSADGGTAWILDRAYIVRNERGHPTRMVGSMTDVSELHRAHEERAALQVMLEQANRVSSLGRVVATIAHEFNNVLMAIQPYAEILRRRSADLPDVERPASQIIQAVKRGKGVTDEILRFTRPSEPVLVPLRVSELFARISAQVGELNLPKIEVRFEKPADDLVIRGDAVQLEQVAMNLVSNARDAMPSGGTLTIAACGEVDFEVTFLSGEELEAWACLSFSDTGDGIPPEIIGKIFEPLFTTKARGGTGLGLAVAQQIVTRHGGYLLASNTPGRGATFQMLLPKAAA